MSHAPAPMDSPPNLLQRRLDAAAKVTLATVEYRGTTRLIQLQGSMEGATIIFEDGSPLARVSDQSHGVAAPRGSVSYPLPRKLLTEVLCGHCSGSRRRARGCVVSLFRRVLWVTDKWGVGMIRSQKHVSVNSSSHLLKSLMIEIEVHSKSHRSCQRGEQPFKFDGDVVEGSIR